KQGPRNGRAVDRHKPAGPPGTPVVDGPGHQFFARTGLALKEHGAVDRGDDRDLVEHSPESLACSNQIRWHTRSLLPTHTPVSLGSQRNGGLMTVLSQSFAAWRGIHSGKELPARPVDQLSKRVRFGTFELDLESGELKRAGDADPGSATLLQEQPFQVLRMLV